MFSHCIYYQIFVISRVSFEQKPQYMVVLLEFYMDIVYLIDMIRCFTQPFSRDGRMVYNRKDIAHNYLKTWFIFDVYAFFPLAYFRYISDYNAGGKDNVKNFLTLNFERLPRFYKLMLIP